MAYLIDTQILIWYQLSNKKLTPQTIQIIETSPTVFVSQVSLFEIAIKQKINKLPELDLSINELLQIIKEDNFNILPIKNEHIAAYHNLPLFETHRDPFDRLILATAQYENIPIISADQKFNLYSEIIQIIDNQ